jgi:FG-GAP-like repeat
MAVPAGVGWQNFVRLGLQGSRGTLTIQGFLTTFLAPASEFSMPIHHRRNQVVALVGIWLALALLSSRFIPAAEPGGIWFEKQQLADKYYCDGVAVGDIDKDGRIDVIAGPFWYAGPDFQQANAFYPPVALDPAKSPSDSMFSMVHDFNDDGWLDILVLGRVHMHKAYWYENPGPPGTSLWKKHFVAERVKGESPTLVDITGDGRPELITHDERQWGWLEPDAKNPTQPWKFVPITQPGEWNQFYHGTGVGDVNRDGRLDLVLNDGWWEQPASLKDNPWKEHKFVFSHDRGGAQMFVEDLNNDGKPDIISSLNAHEWGLAWFEQQSLDKFQEHKIMGDRSELPQYKVAFTQPHALELADIDGDGLKDIITGKRLWAHGPKGDIEPNADPVVYWFRQVREPGQATRFVPILIDDQSGVGVQIVVADVDGDGLPDVLTTSKLGTFVFHQRRKET